MRKPPHRALVPWIILPLALLAAASTRAQEPPAATAASTPAAVVEEPGEEQIHSAYAAALADVNARSVAQLGAADAAPLSIVLEGVNKLSCRQLGDDGLQYDCRVERRISRGGGRSTTDVVQLWLSYEDGQWIAR